MSDQLRKAAQMAYDALSRDPADPIFVGETIDALRAALAQSEPDVGDLLRRSRNLLSHPPSWWEQSAESRSRLIGELDRAALAQPEQTAMPQDIAKVLFDNVESLYVEDTQPEPDYAVCATCGGLSVDPIVKQPEQEPVAWRYDYTRLPQRKPLTDEEIVKICMDCWRVAPSDIYFARAIEKAHGIGVEE